jgi:predicted DNA-binding transcriptional regulator AlpA
MTTNNENSYAESSSRLLRLSNILAPKGPIPVSKSTWWKKVRTGEFPPAVKISERITAWREEHVVALIKRFESGEV